MISVELLAGLDEVQVNLGDLAAFHWPLLAFGCFVLKACESTRCNSPAKWENIQMLILCEIYYLSCHGNPTVCFPHGCCWRERNLVAAQPHMQSDTLHRQQMYRRKGQHFYWARI